MFNKLKIVSYKKFLCLFMILVLSFNFGGCKNRKEAQRGEKKLNIFIDIKDKQSLNTIKFLIEEFEKENPKINVTINNSIGINNVEDVSKEKIGDIIVTSRNKMIELQKKGYLNDLSNYYEKNKINERYYNIFKSYGRFCDKYYGMSIIPYTTEVFYNKEALDKLKLPIPTKINDLDNLLKNLNQLSIRVPVILTEDLDIYNAISSLVVRDKENMYKIDCIYGFSQDFYKERKEFQSLLDDIQNLYKKGVINKNTFELGNGTTIKKFTNGDIPLIISTSHYYNELNKHNIGVIEDYDSMVSFKGSVPVIVNALICLPVNGENGEEVGEFIKFVYSDETQKKLLEKGHITGNINANKELTGIGTTMRKHLEDNNENAILFVYNLPENIYVALTSQIEEILSGKYNGKEWEDILKEVYK
ncbi:MAG: ABC transporter substrate-binding protein [Clostridiaceae bacterium]